MRCVLVYMETSYAYTRILFALRRLWHTLLSPSVGSPEYVVPPSAYWVIDAGRVRLCCGNNAEQALEPTNVAVHFLGYFRVLVACRATMTTYS